MTPTRGQILAASAGWVARFQLPALTLPRIRFPKLRLRRRLRRWKPPALPFPFANKGLGFNSRQLMAVKSRIAGKGLLVVYLTSVIATAMPIQVSNPTWYLALCTGLVNNGPILILALLALSLAGYWDPRANSSFAWPLLWISRLSTSAFALVVVVQLAAAVFFCQQVLAQNSAQLRGL